MRPQFHWGEGLQGAAFAVLLAVVAARPFLNEMPYRGSALRASAVTAGDSAHLAALEGVDRGELSRVSFAVLILAAGALWATGGALRGGLSLRHGWLGVLILLFAGVCLLSALRADDRRTALDVWIEQVSLLAVALLFAQFCAERRRFGLLVIVLSAVGGALAVKGLWQVFVEIPERVSEFQANAAKQLRQAGWAPGTPGAALLEARLRDPAVTGFFGLANPLASLLIVVLAAGAGLAADKLRVALSALRAERGQRPKRQAPPSAARKQVHLPTVAGAASAFVAALVAAALVLTRSRGGIVSAILFAAAAAGALRYRGRLARHWRKAVLIVAGALVLGGGAVAACGLATDRLPTRTLTFRWYYWSASAEIIRDHPLLGVGPGNFPSAYLRYRRAEAEEEVKSPHNVLLDAMTQYGLPGGALYLGMVVSALILLCRPTRGKTLGTETDIARHGRLGDRAGGHGSTRGNLIVLGIAVLAVPLARVLFADAAADAYLLVSDAILPALVLAAFLVAGAWGGSGLFSALGSPASGSRIALACGVGGFLLHSMIEFGPWMPGPAAVFWAAVGALLGQARLPTCLPAGGGRAEGGEADRGPERALAGARWPAAAGAWAAVAASAIVLWWPVYLKTSRTAAVAVRLAAGDVPAAAVWAERAAEADPLDALGAAGAARMHLSACPRGKDADFQAPLAAECLRRAEFWAEQAIRRDPGAFGHYQLAGNVAWMQANRDLLKYAWTPPPERLEDIAAKLRSELAQNPRDEVLMSRLARVAVLRREYAEGVALCEKALTHDPRSAVLAGQLGDAACRAGLREEAEAAWRRAAELAPAGPVCDRALGYMHRAVELNPRDVRLRIAYAEMLCSASRFRDCLAQVEAAVKTDRLLLPASFERLTPSEDEAVTVLNARAHALVSGKKGILTGGQPGG